MSKLNEWSAENLERAAKHMRELDKSMNAKAAIELAKREQDVEMARSATEAKRQEALKAQYAGEVERIRWEEQRRTLELKKENEKQMIDYKIRADMQKEQEKDKMARQRDEENRRRAIEDERAKAMVRAKAEEEIQAERRRTDEHRAKLERENMKARALAEAEGRIREQRENEDVHNRALALRLGEERVTRVQAIQEWAKQAQAMVTDFLSDPGKIAGVALLVTAAAGGVYGMRETARVVGRIVETRLGKPSLVRETSRMSGHFGVRARLARAIGMGPTEGTSLSDVVLRKEMEGRIGRIAAAVANTKANAAPFRHLMFYGPPGTGKTMVAKRLARSSGLDYAIMTGGDIGPLGKDAVTELHKMFDWAQTSKRGLVLFIDEADAFLSSRSKAGMSEDHRNALNALLYRTGEASKNFMMVLATNRPGDLDRALVDRVDESLVFDLPDLEARRRLVKQYFSQYITRAGADAKRGPLGLFGTRPSAHIKVEAVGDEALEDIAMRTEGFSGREISKLFASVQADVYGRGAPAVLTKAILQEVVATKIKEHHEKDSFSASARFDYVATGAAGAAMRAASASSAAGAASAAAKQAAAARGELA